MEEQTPDYEEFERRYTLVKNANPHHDGEPAASIFETFAPDIDFVRAQPDSRIWTIIDGGDGRLYLTAGFHHVNRIGYFITNEDRADENESYVYAKRNEETEETTQPEPAERSFLVRFRESEHARLRGLIGEGQTEEALALLETISSRSDRCLWAIVFEHRHGQDIYMAVGDTRPDATAMISRISEWEGAHASEMFEEFEVSDIRFLKQSEDFQVAEGACPRCSTTLPTSANKGCPDCSLCADCCRHPQPLHTVRGCLDEVSQTG